MAEENYCIYCRLTEKEIRKINRNSGFRVPCDIRDTKKGFHSFGRRKIKEVHDASLEVNE